jgi:cytoskeletal protein CcmA (bactofilin family)
MTIGGTFEGEVEASNELIILPTGKCTGKVVCRDFVVEPGGILNAQVNCTAGLANKKEVILSKPEISNVAEKATRVVQKFSKDKLPEDVKKDE